MLYHTVLCCALLCHPGEVVPRAYDEYDVSDRLKESGWVLPAYTMAPDAKHIKLLRAVIRYVRGALSAAVYSSLVCTGSLHTKKRGLEGNTKSKGTACCIQPVLRPLVCVCLSAGLTTA